MKTDAVDVMLLHTCYLATLKKGDAIAALLKARAAGKKVVTIQGQRIPVNASIRTMGGLSGHADQSDLVNWFDTMAASRPRVILTHGEDKARTALGKIIADRYQIRAELPRLNEVIEI